MFRATILRQARLCRTGAAPHSAFAAGARTATLRATAQPWAARSTLLRPSPTLLTSAAREYSSAAAPQATEEAGQPSSGPVTVFADLASLGVNGNLVRALTEDMRYETMTEVQSMTINPALAGKDIVAQAKTGTGKTLAFLIPIVQRILASDPSLAHRGRFRAKSDNIRAIILSPTRELAEQIGQEARKLVRGTGLIVQTAVGGTHKSSMLRQTRREGCHLLVATPGRLNDLLGDPYSGIAAPHLDAFVLDEADRMLDVGFEQELREIVQRLPDRTQVPRQTLLFSATIPSNVVQLARAFVDAENFEFVQTVKGDEVPTHEKVPQHILPVKGYENLFPALLELYERESAAMSQDGNSSFKSIVFLQTTAMVELAHEVFSHLKRIYPKLPPMYPIHSKLTQGQRTDAAETFRRARSAILFSSDVTARGMDFPNVSHVIQVGVPTSRDQYIHRIGRTGRADKSGQAWLLVSEAEIDFARRTLPGLPIQRAKGIESADCDLSRADESTTPSAVKLISQTIKGVDRRILSDAFMSHFGGAMKGMSPQTILDELNAWVRYGWGWDQPPAISAHIAQKRGLSRLRGIRIAEPEHDDNSWRRDSGRRDQGRSFGSGRSSGGGRDGRDRRRSPRDGFEAMEQNEYRERRRAPPRSSF